MVKNITTFSDIVLYWDIMDCKTLDEKFYIYFDGDLYATTEKTHVEIRNIEKKSFSIEIYTDADKNNLFYKENFILPEKPKFIDITSAPYNAVGDNKTLNTKSIQSAIDDCKEGECVYIPAGTFLTGALNLHSNMSLYIEKDGVLQGSQNPEDYLPKIWTRFEGIEMECYSSLLNTGNIENRDEICCENIMIHGGGKISGGGFVLANSVIDIERERLKNDPDFTEFKNEEIPEHIPGKLRPKLINISCTKNVVMDNLDIENGSCWNIHMIYSDNVVTCNCRFFSYDVHNGDGWDPDSSTNCTLFNCDFNTGDDCVAIKSGKNPEGNVINKPCKEIRVFDCRSAYGHGFAIGSEMSGGVDGVYVWDCDMEKTKFGLEIKCTKNRGGYVKNVYVARTIVPRIMMHTIDYDKDDKFPAPTTPVFSDCKFEKMIITGEALEHKSNIAKSCAGIDLEGFDDENVIRNIVFDNIVFDNYKESVSQTISVKSAKNVTISNISAR